MSSHNTYPERKNSLALPVILLTSGLFLLLSYTLLSIEQAGGLAAQVQSALPKSGAESPVTAVLLNFRGYDTLLEVMVLFLSILGAWSIGRASLPQALIKTSTIQISCVRLLIPLMILIAFYLVWQGTRFAGGAFQGGSILAAAGVLLLVSDFPKLIQIHSIHLRLGFILGPVTFILIAFYCIFTNKTFMAYPAAIVSQLLLFIEIACAISIGLTLAALFAGGRPAQESSIAQRKGSTL